jgi:alpha,alpha-trehalase
VNVFSPQELEARIGQRGVALFLDYDGTLTPIVRRPEEALLPSAMRDLLHDLSQRCTTSIVSGRDRVDVEHLVGLKGLFYAGSHGFDIHGPGGLALQHPEATEALPELAAAEREITEGIRGIAGAHVERKRFGVALHYREVADEEIPRVEDCLLGVHSQHPTLRKMSGKKVFELQPDVEWNKGKAVRWLLDALALDPARTLSIYIGDDVTDEDAFHELQLLGASLGLRVGDPVADSYASHFLRDCREVQQFLVALRTLLDDRAKSDG